MMTGTSVTLPETTNKAARPVCALHEKETCLEDKTMKEKVLHKMVTLQLKKDSVKERFLNLMGNNAGESLSTSQLAWIIVAVVIVLGLGVALYAIFNTELLPEVQKKLEAMFNIG